MANNTILITPETTLIAGKSITPDSVSVVLPNGHSYDLDTILELLTKHDKKTVKGPKLTTRLGIGYRAFKQAMKETDDK